MRLIADLLRGKEIGHALNILKFNPKHSAKYLEKLLLSAISTGSLKMRIKVSKVLTFLLMKFELMEEE